MAATGQMWKLHMGTAAYAVGFVLMVWGATHGMDYQFIAAGVVTGALGTAFCSIAVRCPKCGARWYWTALRHAQPGFARRLGQQSQCASCGYTTEGQ